MNRKAFNRINYGLFILGVKGETQLQGCLINSLHQVTSSMPFKFSITVNKSNETYKAIEAAGTFAATVLSKDASKDLVELFGRKSGRVVNKFDGLAYETDVNGNPYFKENAVARFACKVVDKLDLGNSVLYIGQTMEAEVVGEGLALTLDDYNNAGAPAAPTATVVRFKEENVGWRCTICGYIAEMETLPEGFQCPLCRANRDKFVKI